MTFCIECGTKAPEIAKFCPQCGMALVSVDAVSEPILSSADVTPKVVAPEIETAETSDVVETKIVAGDIVEAVETDIELNTGELETDGPTSISAANDVTPSAAASLATAANQVEDAPKSKAGLLVGLGLIALIAAGGGAYALGLFGGEPEDPARIASASETTPSASLPTTNAIEPKTDDPNPVLSAYQEAIKTGRISDLGQFAKDYPKDSLAKDAETAAFESLQRQSSVLAFNTFTEYFPDADLSAYSGPRRATAEEFDANGFSNPSTDQPIETTSTAIRPSITQRANELEPFIAQGDKSYALAVLDEMLGMSDLAAAEATYLLNLRGRAETSSGFAAPAELEPVEPAPIEASPEQAKLFQPVSTEPVIPAPAAIVVTPAPAPEAPAATVPETPAAMAAFDTPAKPVERFGSITPDEATAPGECDMAFSVNTSGSPVNIIASCTDPIFVEPAKTTVGEWTYSPALLAGQPVQQNGVVVKIKFHLE